MDQQACSRARTDRSERLRVVLVTHYFPAHRGGVETVAGRLARELAAAHGVEIDWFASDCDPAPASDARLRCHAVRSWNGIERRTGLPFPVWSPRGLARLATAIAKADAVHVHDFLYPSNALALVASLAARTPALVTQHIGPVPLQRPWLSRAIGLVNREIGARLLARAAATVFIGDSVKRYFEAFGRFGTPPALVPNGVDTDVFSPVAPERRRELKSACGLDPSRPVMLYVGRFVDKKGMPLLRELAASRPDLQWSFAGWGPSDPARWELPNVRVHRGLSGPTLADLYRAADLLLLPSRSEGFALVVQEAMACGTPALVSDAAAEGSPPAKPLLFHEPVDGADAFARWSSRLDALVRDPAGLEAARERLAAFARAQWSWTGCAARYRALLDGIARHDRRQGST